MDKFNKAMERKLRRIDVDISERCSEMEFSMYRGEGGEMVEVVANFKYLGRTLDQMDDDWPAVRQNIMHTRLVLGMLGTLIRQEGGELKVSEMFYRAVEQAVLIFGSDTWALLAKIERKVEGTHTCFLWKITGK